MQLEDSGGKRGWKDARQVSVTGSTTNPNFSKLGSHWKVLRRGATASD